MLKFSLSESGHPSGSQKSKVKIFNLSESGCPGFEDFQDCNWWIVCKYWKM